MTNQNDFFQIIKDDKLLYQGIDVVDDYIREFMYALKTKNLEQYHKRGIRFLIKKCR